MESREWLGVAHWWFCDNGKCPCHPMGEWRGETRCVLIRTYSNARVWQRWSNLIFSVRHEFRNVFIYGGWASSAFLIHGCKRVVGETVAAMHCVKRNFKLHLISTAIAYNSIYPNAFVILLHRFPILSGISKRKIHGKWNSNRKLLSKQTPCLFYKLLGQFNQVLCSTLAVFYIMEGLLYVCACPKEVCYEELFLVKGILLWPTAGGHNL